MRWKRPWSTKWNITAHEAREMALSYDGSQTMFVYTFVYCIDSTINTPHSWNVSKQYRRYLWRRNNQLTSHRTMALGRNLYHGTLRAIKFSKNLKNCRFQQFYPLIGFSSVSIRTLFFRLLYFVFNFHYKIYSQHSRHNHQPRLIPFPHLTSTNIYNKDL